MNQRLDLIQMLALAQAYWDLIRGAKKWLAVTLGLFFLATAAGVVIGITEPGLVDQVCEHLGGPETGFAAFIIILKKNLRAMLISWCGSLVLAIGPLFHTLAVGLLFGALLVHGGVSYFLVAALPHGTVELPAILLSNTFFLRLGVRWAFQKNATERKRSFVTDFQNSLRIGLLCAFLFLLAAAIESFATPKILAAYEKGHLAGIGVQLAVHEHQLTITHVFPGGPASKAGLSSGLLIQTIDGTETTGKNLGQCRNMTHGRVGTKVKLEVIDTAHTTTNTVELVREIKP
ncbi:MAG: stage II sporulation protein M [Limisphaerales bacterium]